MNYMKIYNQLIEKRQTNPISKIDGYCENHHIIPLSLGGNNNKDNLVYLLAREHYIAHALLFMHYKQCGNKNNFIKMAFAIGRLMTGNKCFRAKLDHRFNSRLYQLIKAQISKIRKGIPSSTKGKRFIHNLQTNENRMIDKKMPLPIGYAEGVFFSPELKKKMSKATKGKIYIRNVKTNELKLIDKNQKIPNGWEKKRTKLNLSEEQLNRHIQNARNNKGQTGKRLIVNQKTGQKRFLLNSDLIPLGWKYSIDISQDKHRCIDCNKHISKKAIRCRNCSEKLKHKKSKM